MYWNVFLVPRIQTPFAVRRGGPRAERKIDRMRDTYESPLSSRYADKEMKYLFSPDMKFKTWRRLWIALAESEMELGLPVTQEQVDELKAHADDINYEVAEARERVVRHDVMSHVYAYGQQCPKAAGIIHLGATSCYVGDNTDIIIMTEAMKVVRKKLVNVIRVLSKFAEEYKDLPTLAFTHFQPAQPTTVGKRATLWIQEFLMDLEDVEYQIGKAKLLGSKGTTSSPRRSTARSPRSWATRRASPSPARPTRESSTARC